MTYINNRVSHAVSNNYNYNDDIKL